MLSLLVYSSLSGPAHPPKEKYSLSQLLLWLALSARIQWPFRTSTPSQREIFSQSCYCGLLCVFAFQDQHTLPKRNILSKLLLWPAHMEFPLRTSTPSQREIFSQRCYCGLLVWSFLSGPAHPPKEKYSLKAVIVACSVYLHFRISTPSQSQIFSLTAVIVTCSMYLHFRTSTPSRSEIFSQVVIVACSLCSYTVAFQDHH